ncbi:MAG TPA: hypothetical protein VGM87_18795 [Roseomonas sp.]|jgi:hypothetical protein
MPWHERYPRIRRWLRGNNIAGVAALLLFLLGVGGLGAGWQDLFWIPPVCIGAVGLIATSGRRDDGEDNWP